MKNSIALLSLLLSPNTFADVEADMPLNYKSETEASTAILFLELQSQGLAGGDSGVCIDLDYDVNGRPIYRAALDTAVFNSGEATLPTSSNAPNGLNPEKFRRLAEAISASQNKKIDVTIDGYSDGQHYDLSPYSLEASIAANQKLATDRANTLGDLLKKNPNINVVAINGHASAELERRYPQRGKGLNCPSRRKVVVNFAQAAPAIRHEIKANFFQAPESMSDEVKTAFRDEFNASVEDARNRLGIQKTQVSDYKQRANRADVEKIYSDLQKQKKLNPRCDLPPFKQMTLAMIEDQISETPVKATYRKRDDLVKSYFKESGFGSSNLSGGKSALEHGCLIPSNETLNKISKTVKDYAVSGADFMKTANLNESDGQVKIAFDIKSLSSEKPPHGPHQGESVRGFYCKECGAGLYFKEDPKQKGKFTTEYIDRAVKVAGAQQEQFRNNLESLSNGDPFSVGAFLKPRLYIIQNCKNCECDSSALIRAKSSQVVELDPMKNGQTSQILSSADFKTSCVVRPPVHHSCNVSPNDNKASNIATTDKMYEIKSAHFGLLRANNLNALVAQAANVCPVKDTNLSANERVKDVFCAPKKDLPSNNEFADCAKYERK